MPLQRSRVTLQVVCARSMVASVYRRMAYVYTCTRLAHLYDLDLTSAAGRASPTCTMCARQLRYPLLNRTDDCLAADRIGGCKLTSPMALLLLSLPKASSDRDACSGRRRTKVHAVYRALAAAETETLHEQIFTFAAVPHTHMTASWDVPIGQIPWLRSSWACELALSTGDIATAAWAGVTPGEQEVGSD
jgi:hypothetical protein